MQVLLVGAGGFVGAIARYLVDTWLGRSMGTAFPWGTVVVNATGSFVLGLLFALLVERSLGPADLRIPILVGFLGAYTTFSTYLLDSWRLVEQGNWPLAAVNLFGSIALGLAALLVGMSLGRSI